MIYGQALFEELKLNRRYYYVCRIVLYSWFEHTAMEILTLGWVSLLVVFTWSIAMVVWGRNGL